MPYVVDALTRISPSLPPTLEELKPARAPRGTADSRLTYREREVLQWTAMGKGCWETGQIVGISERTVKFHLQNIYRKLNVVNRAQAIAKAAERQLLPPMVM